MDVYQWDKLSAGTDKHQRFQRPASEARRSRTKLYRKHNEATNTEQNVLSKQKVKICSISYLDPFEKFEKALGTRL